MDRISAALLREFPNIAEVVEEIANNCSLFGFDPIQLDFDTVTNQEIVDYITAVAVEQYWNLHTEHRHTVYPDIVEFGNLEVLDFWEYYNFNQYIEQIVDIQINHLMYSFYTVNYQNTTTLFFAETFPDYHTIIYKVY